MDLETTFLWGCVVGITIVCVVGLITGLNISRRLQSNHPLKWTEFGFPRNWMSPSTEEESSQVQGQINLLLFLLSNEYKHLNDPLLNRLAILQKRCLALGLLFLVLPLIAWFRAM